jgi:hypothetical protein
VVAPRGVVARTTVRLTGAMRRRLEGDEGELLRADELRKRLYASWSRELPDVELVEVGEPRVAADGAWSYTASLRAPEALGRFGDLRVFDLPPLLPPQFVPVPDAEKDTSGYLPALLTFRQIDRIAAPGLRSEGLPAPWELENSVGRVALRVRAAVDGVAIERELGFKSVEVQSAQREQALELKQALRRVNHVSLVFEVGENP